MNKGWKYFLLPLISISGIACNSEADVREIDLEKSEHIIDYVDQLNLSTLVLNDQNLIINYTLILINPDSLKRPLFHKYQVSMEEWELKREVPAGTLENLLSLLNESGNNRVVKEKEAYFFKEGGWIDSDFGKVYSKQQLTGKAKDFKFDRVQEIKPIGDRENWYVYYAD
ncbi:hypothetical protein [uncultured Pontibacter sp.]|uniref:hypothetical protein n=1 Tax=uncultured Pontibacter sp. TaxID=453356 RepID=UPI002628801A|nr:hypothetical protein [uncultured Pontibacter sp.]